MLGEKVNAWRSLWLDASPPLVKREEETSRLEARERGPSVLPPSPVVLFLPSCRAKKEKGEWNQTSVCLSTGGQKYPPGKRPLLSCPSQRFLCFRHWQKESGSRVTSGQGPSKSLSEIPALILLPPRLKLQGATLCFLDSALIRAECQRTFVLQGLRLSNLQIRPTAMTAATAVSLLPSLLFSLLKCTISFSCENALFCINPSCERETFRTEGRTAEEQESAFLQ